VDGSLSVTPIPGIDVVAIPIEFDVPSPGLKYVISSPVT